MTHDDIGRLERELAELRSSEEALKLAPLFASVGSWDWDLVTNHVYWSEEMFRLFGIVREAFDHTPEGAARLFHPGDRERVAASIANAREGYVFPAEFRILRPDGSERVVWGQGEIVRDEAGTPVRMFGSLHDITEVKSAEGGLGSEQLLQMTLSDAKMGLWQWDIETGEVHWSPGVYTVFGQTEQGFGGTYTAYLDSIHPEDRGPVEASIRRALDDPAAGGRYHVEHRVFAADGAVRWIAGTGRVFRDAAGKAVRMAGTVADVTDRKRLESDLLQSQRLESVGRLAGGVAHDLNNILTVVFGGVSEAAENPRDTAAVAECLEMIENAAHHAAQLTSQLLAFARRQKLELRRVDLNELVQQVEQLLRRTLGDRVVLVTQLASEGCDVEADPVQLEQVLVNLVTNARDAMPEGGEVRVRTTAVQRDGVEHARLVVEDDGEGMEESELAHIFEPFYTTKCAGHGLGLASCYGIVKQLRGDITVRSSPGVGTTFVLDLPRVDRRESDVATDAAVDKGPVPDPDRGETVLLVEDEPVVRHVLVRHLARCGYEVLQAPDGHEALAEVDRRGGEIDILVSDTVMPGMNGPELARKVRDRVPDISVLLISGYAQKGSEPLIADDQPFMQKPFTPAALSRRVRELLDRRQG